MTNILSLSALLVAATLLLPFGQSRLVGKPPTDASTHTFREAATGLLMHENLVKEHRVAASQFHEVTFVIQQRNMDELKSILYDISDPESDNYGKHLTREEVADRTANPDSRNAVVAYLETFGATVVSETPHGEYIIAQAPVSLWEKMFDTEFFAYTVLPPKDLRKMETDTNIIKIIRAEKYSVPTCLDSHIESVLSVIQMPSMHSRKVSPLPFTSASIKSLDFSAKEWEGYVTPALLKRVYNVDTDVSHNKATQAVFELYEDSYSKKDIEEFQDTFNLPRLAVNVSIGNYTASQSYCAAKFYNCAESNLDLQYIMAMSPSPTTHYHSDVGLSSYWLFVVSSASNVPKVISISWGYSEIYATMSEMNAFNREALKLGVMGTTILVATGDDGVASFRARYDSTQCSYDVDFPAGSEYVTAVGATMVRT